MPTSAVPGIVTATCGNHGQSLAFAGSRAGIAVTIVVRSIVTLAILVVVLLLRHPF